MAALIAALVASLVAGAAPAAATWSAVGVDEATGEVGVALASCVPGQALGPLDAPLFPVTLAPGVGAAVTQGQVAPAVGVKVAELFEIGLDADAVLAFVTAPEFDDQADARQYALITLGDGAGGGAIVASQTGPSVPPPALDRAGADVSVVGDQLVDESVVTDAFESLALTAGAPLADRLVAALAAGAEAGGDRRCEGQTALFAQLAVAEPGDDPTQPSTLLTVVVNRGDDNPVTMLVDLHEAGEVTAVVVPEGGGRGLLLNTIGALAGLVMVVGGVVFWRQAYRRPRRP